MLSSSRPSQARCPLCGFTGCEMIVSFDCDNPRCSNHGARRSWSEPEVRCLLESMWDTYRASESLDDFIARFYDEGGRIERDPEHPDLEHARVIKPDWLERRARYLPPSPEEQEPE